MSKGDLLVERGAAKLQELSRKAASRGDGVGEWLSEELREDAEFLRRLKPSLIAARARGGNPPPQAAEAPRDYAAPPSAPPPPPPPPGEQKPKKQKKQKSKAKRGGPSPWLIVGAAFVAGVVAAKVIDWRGHAHPRD
jgi:hypothetical protein